MYIFRFRFVRFQFLSRSINEMFVKHVYRSLHVANKETNRYRNKYKLCFTTTREYFDQRHLRVFGYLPKYDRQLIFSSLYSDNIIVLQNSIAVILLSGSRMKNMRVFHVYRVRYTLI